MRMTSRPRVSTRIAEPTASITSIDLGLGQLPRPRREGIGLRGQRADRAEIDDVALQLRGQRLLEIGGDLHVLAAADGAELRHARHLGREADAARALDAAVHRRLDQRAEILVLDGALVLLEAAGVDAVGHRLVLQVALAALVADRAVERVIDEQELHHPFARLLHHRRLGVDDRRLAVRARPAVAHAPRRSSPPAWASPSARPGTCGNCRRSTAARGSRSAESPRPPPRTPAAACTPAGRRSLCRRR